MTQNTQSTKDLSRCTKAELLEIIKQNMPQQQHMTPVEQRAQQEKVQLKNNEQITVNSLMIGTSELSQAKATLNEIIDRLSESFANPTQSLDEINQLIKIKQDELNTLYGIETNAEVFEALRVGLEKYKTQVNADKAQLKKDYDAAREQLEAERKDLYDKIARDRAVEQSSYDYNTKQKRIEEERKFNDSLNIKKLEFDKDLAKRTEEFENRMYELVIRENTVEELTNQLISLQVEVERLNSTFETRTEKEVEKRLVIFKRDLENIAKMEKIQNSNELALVKQQLEFKTNECESLKTELVDIKVKLADAAEKANQLAASAISASGNQKVVVNQPAAQR